MKLRPRLWLFGVVLPAVGLAITIVVAGELFRLSLIRNLDEAMRAQASVERVSLFDGPSGEPHLVERDDSRVVDTADHPSVVAVYDRSGRALIQFPHGSHSPPRLAWSPSDITELGTTRDDATGRPVRELRMVVHSTNGNDYLLRLASPMSSIETTVRTFYRATSSVAVIVALLLLLAQAWQAHTLVRRLRAMTDYLPKLRDGVLDLAALPEDRAGDEIAEQRDALADAAVRLQRARVAQERLLANAAHELRTPLTIMRTQMDLALRRERSAEELRAALAASRAEVDRLAYLAARLLELAAASKVERELRSGDLVELLNESIAAYRATAEQGAITLSLVAPGQATATFDQTALRQAVDNLLANACRHAPPSSTIEVGLTRDATHWRITVRDQGKGVAPEERERVFEPFYRGGNSAGAGLGLAIVRDIARMHAGEAAAEGSRFTLTVRADGPLHRPE